MDKDIRMLDYVDGFAVHKDVHSVLIHDSDTSLVPLVSIMIPTYRRPDLLRESVESALAQTSLQPFEVVVIDNDNDPEMSARVDQVIASFDAPNLRLFRNEANIGMFGNWNRCIELARGYWLTILNDDDLLDPFFLTESLKIVSKNDLISLVGCKVKTLDERNNKNPATVLGAIRLSAKYILGKLCSQKPHELKVSDYFLSNQHHGCLGVLMKRSVALTLGGFFPGHYPSSDYIFLVKFAMSNVVYFLPRALASCRIGVNESLNPELCVDWMQQGLKLREELMPHLNANLRLLYYYSRLCAINSAYSYRDLWNSSFDVCKALADDGVVSRSAWHTFIMLLISRSVLHINFAIQTKGGASTGS